MYRILSLDGGGICGLLTAILLDRLEKMAPGFLDNVDLYAGTSTGGILAVGLAAGITPLELSELYDGKGRDVFDDSLVDNLLDIGNAIGAKYSNRSLQILLSDKLGEFRLKDLHRRVLISSFDLDNADDPKRKPGSLRTWKPKFFHNFEGPDSDGEEKAVDVALRTSAAPTYFPVYQGFIDGGVAANNPSMCAVAQVLRERKATLDQIVVLSFGTGDNERFLDFRKVQSADWGWAQWATQLPGIMVSANVGVADYQCRQIFGERYLRVNPPLNCDIALDGLDGIPTLKTVGNAYDLAEVEKWLKANWFAEKAATPTPPALRPTTPPPAAKAKSKAKPRSASRAKRAR